MNLSISNIAWLEEEDEKVYRLMNKYHIKGLEIAPTRFFKENPYNSTLEQIKKIEGLIVKERGSYYYNDFESIKLSPA